MAEASHAVFLSYASQDAEAAKKIAVALRTGGIEVFLDQSELRGGDAWDQKIRHEIHECVIFIPIISQHSQERLEGYFRHEWNLAVERAHHMARQKSFLVPVVVDGTGDREALVPDEFRAVQWTRLTAGETPPAFVERIKRLLSPDLATASQAPASPVPGAAPGIRGTVRASQRSKPVQLAIIAVVVLATPAAYFWISKHPTPSLASFAPPAHSIAVLPFVNMSGDKEQEYFSEGLTEEILNSLTEVTNLQVAARTSSFYFKGKDVDLGTIAHKLNVASVLEGSVRRSGNTVRITAQLINAITGYHLWSHTYDRDLGDVLKLETEIAGAVASALKVSLLGEQAARIELGGTRNPAAFDAYLRGRKAGITSRSSKDRLTVIATLTEAIGLDPNYALAFANRSIEFSEYAGNEPGSARRESFDKAQADAEKAIALAPDLAEGHMALAVYFENGALDLGRASAEYERALALAPGNARVLISAGFNAVMMGRTEAGIAALRRAIALDPLSRNARATFGRALYFARQSQEALVAFQDTHALDPEYSKIYADSGLAYYALRDFEHAHTSCESNPDYWASQQCLAVSYEKLGRHVDAERVLAKMKAEDGDDAAYQYAAIYAQWGNGGKALEWLETAMRLRDPGLVQLKTDPLMDPLHKEPRFLAVMRELKFPN